MNKLAIIAAAGDLSKKLINFCLHSNIPIFVVAITDITDPQIIKDVDHVWIKLGEIGKAIEAMRASAVNQVVFVGSLKKPDLFNLKVDILGAKLLAKITKNKLFGDDKILSSVTLFIEQYGFKVIGVQEILQNLLVDEANFTKIAPNAKDKDDIALGIKVVTQLGSLDIGQAVIVQNGVVLGVEAVEGTDNLINRCGKLKFSEDFSGMLVKFSKPNQELRMDLPTVGLQTIKNAHKAGFKGIVIEANRSIFLDQKEVIEFADKHGMFVCAIKASR